MTAGFSVVVTVSGLADGEDILAPAGLATPQAVAAGVTVDGGRMRMVFEAATAQAALHVRPEAPEVTLRYAFLGTPGRYPEEIFRPAPSRFTRAAEALIAEAEEMAGTGDAATRAHRIARRTAERFDYGHPEVRFNDGLDHVPALGCGMTEGSCVDINTYFLAALRSAGIEAGYVTGAFFPAEKRDWCSDGHCWVVTRIDGETQEWDIAHHLKLGTRDIRPALNPKPGFRVALGHSMGLTFPMIGLHDLKALITPLALIDGRVAPPAESRIRLFNPALAA